MNCILNDSICLQKKCLYEVANIHTVYTYAHIQIVNRTWAIIIANIDKKKQTNFGWFNGFSIQRSLNFRCSSLRLLPHVCRCRRHNAWNKYILSFPSITIFFIFTANKTEAKRDEENEFTIFIVIWWHKINFSFFSSKILIYRLILLVS